MESLSSDTSTASSHIGGAEADPSPDKDIVIIADVDHSKCVVRHILEADKPDAMAVCCYGDLLGTEKSKIQLLVLVTDDQAYAYRLKDDDGTIIKEGNVKELFYDPRINKVLLLSRKYRKFVKQHLYFTVVMLVFINPFLLFVNM